MPAYDAFSNDTISDIDSPAVETSTTGQGRPKGKRKPDPNKVWERAEAHLSSMSYSRVPGRAADDNRLKDLHRRFLMHIGRQEPSRGWAQISQAQLAKTWGCSRERLNRAIRDLVSWDYLQKLPQPEAHNRWCAYKVVFEPRTTCDAQDHTSPSPSAATCDANSHTSNATCDAQDHTTCDTSGHTSRAALSIEEESVQADQKTPVQEESAQARPHAPEQQDRDLFAHEEKGADAPQVKPKPTKVGKPKAKKPREEPIELPEEALLPDEWRAAPAEAGMTSAEMDETWDAMKRWANGANKDSTTVRRTERGWRNTWPTFWKGDLKKLRASRSNGRSMSHAAANGPGGWTGAAFSVMEGNAHG